MSMKPSPPLFSQLVQDFFCQYLLEQRNASRHTVASYRDTFRLLLGYADRHLGKKPSDLVLTDLDASFILAFLNHLENDRLNSIASRNIRLAAIRSFLNYAALRDPGALATIQRVQAIPSKRYDQPMLGFLTREEMQAILEAPDRSTWSGERDYAMWATFYNTGARVSEVIALRMRDLDLDRRSCVEIWGKGRKQRLIPLWKTTTKILAHWKERVRGEPDAPAFPNRNGRPLTRSGVEDRLRRAVRKAAEQCPTLRERRVSPHTLRHTTAMHLLQSGVDITVIALWLGHENLETTHHYVEADLEMKRQALENLGEPSAASSQRYCPSDRLLAFLESL